MKKVMSDLGRATRREWVGLAVIALPRRNRRIGVKETL